jgi:hypothetical protein
MPLTLKIDPPVPGPLTIQDNLLQLPRIVLVPAQDNMSWLTSITLKVEDLGDPKSPDLAKQIETAYGNPSPGPVTASTQFPWASRGWNRPVPPGCRFRVTVTAHYYRSNAFNRADVNAGILDSQPLVFVLTGSTASTPVPPPRVVPTLPTPAPGPTPPAPSGPVPYAEQLTENEVLVYPGVLALDFGTCSTTVTLFNPDKIYDQPGLPPEQEARLIQLIRERLCGEGGTCRLPGVLQDQWERLMTAVGRNLGGPRGEPGQAVFLQRLQAGGLATLRALRQLELNLAATIEDETSQEELELELNRIYHEAFREPRLRSQNLVPAGLDETAEEQFDLASELRVDLQEAPVRVRVGRQVRLDRLSALAQATSAGTGFPPGPPGEPAGPASLGAVQVRQVFHHSPKRYLGQEKLAFQVPYPSGVQTVTAERLLQSAWGQVLDLVDGWRRRQPGECLDGPFTRVVVTYPTVASPAIRRQVLEMATALLRERGVREPDVVTDYDEAVAAALFYLHREFGGSLDLGPEEFKSRARRIGDSWAQNVLVLDIGGGSTDVALLRLQLREDNSHFKPGDGRGAGGRAYILTPRLLGSSGNTQLGGELITLRLFQLLKAALADRLLWGLSSGALTSATLAARLTQLGPAFQTNGQYVEGSLVKPVVDQPDNSPERVAALNAAEQVLPTRWLNDPTRLQPFYSLWEHAEQAKIQLGRSPEGGEEPSFQLGAREVDALAPQFGLSDLKVQNSDAVCVHLSAEQFTGLTEPVIRDAVAIAVGLMASRLPKEGDNRERLDWLILSGKTCHLALVQQVLRQQLLRSPYFIWNPDRVTFLPRYAKLATSAGACYAEKLRRLDVKARDVTGMLRQGLSQLTFEIDNLFFFLPCSFLLPVADGVLTLFEAGENLFQLDGQPVGKARTGPLGSQLLMSVMRRDYEQGQSLLWGSLDGADLAREMELAPNRYLEQVRVQFEVDQRLDLNAFLWVGEKPHHAVDPNAPSLNLAEAWQRHQSMAAPTLPPPGAETPVQAGWSVSLDALRAQTAGGGPTAVISADDTLDCTFHLVAPGEQGGETRQGLVRPIAGFVDETGHTIGDCFESDEIVIHARPPGSTEYVRLGTLPRPDKDAGSQHAKYRRRYSLSLDDQGVLRVHLGEIPYWTTTRPRDVLEQPGRTLVRPISPSRAPAGANRDPFSGVH